MTDSNKTNAVSEAAKVLFFSCIENEAREMSFTFEDGEMKAECSFEIKNMSILKELETTEGEINHEES